MSLKETALRMEMQIGAGTELNQATPALSALPRFCGWVFCNPNAVKGRSMVIQINEEVVIGFTDMMDRFILANCKAGEIGQMWEGTEFKGEPTGVGYGFLGEEGSAVFANGVEATKAFPKNKGNRLEACPKFGSHQFSEENMVEVFPGLAICLRHALDREADLVYQAFLGAFKAITVFAISDAPWGDRDLP